MFEMPFTQAGKRQGGVEEQCKRRTILTGTGWMEISFKRRVVFCVLYLVLDTRLFYMLCILSKKKRDDFIRDLEVTRIAKYTKILLDDTVSLFKLAHTWK